jgi:hypothetical protein
MLVFKYIFDFPITGFPCTRSYEAMLLLILVQDHVNIMASISTDFSYSEITSI